MSYGLWFVVIFVTSMAAFWVGNRVNRPKRVPVARLADPAPLPGELPHAGRFDVTWHDPTFTGASEPVPWDLAGAAYALGQQRADQDDISRQVDEIMLRVQNDARWDYR